MFRKNQGNLRIIRNTLVIGKSFSNFQVPIPNIQIENASPNVRTSGSSNLHFSEGKVSDNLHQFHFPEQLTTLGTGKKVDNSGKRGLQHLESAIPSPGFLTQVQRDPHPSKLQDLSQRPRGHQNVSADVQLRSLPTLLSPGQEPKAIKVFLYIVINSCFSLHAFRRRLSFSHARKPSVNDRFSDNRLAFLNNAFYSLSVQFQAETFADELLLII